MQFAELSAPFPPSQIEWRVGSTNSEKTRGLALAYLTARHVMERLDALCGQENWQDRYEFHGSRTVCYLSLRIGDEWITKADGAGDSDVEAEKGAISDALKRAAVKWGIGRYLYDLGNTWVEVEPAGRSVKIKAHEFARLEKMLADRFGAEATEPSAPVKRLSAQRAAQLLRQDVLLEHIDSLKTVRGLEKMSVTVRTDLAFIPLEWEDQFLQRIDQRRTELGGKEPPGFDTQGMLERSLAMESAAAALRGAKSPEDMGSIWDGEIEGKFASDALSHLHSVYEEQLRTFGVAAE